MSLRTGLCALSWSGFVLVSCVSGSAAGPPQPPAGPITVRVDARDVPARLLHVRETIPARPGALTLYYPEWLPGTGGRNDAIAHLAGLRLSALGKPVAWRRDTVEAAAFHCEVPAGAAALEVEIDMNLPASPDKATASTQVAGIGWDLLYPKGVKSDDLTIAASVALPPGWQMGTALPVVSRNGDVVELGPVSLTTLIDSPIVAGAHFRSIRVSEGPAPIFIDVAADSEAALAVSDKEVAAHRRLFAEAQALFGARHYRGYHELFVLSDHIRGCALEHHESFIICAKERLFLDDALHVGAADVFAHELAHSWTGKYRRPAGLTAPDFNHPLRYDLQWVYEGLTEYLGYVLAARSGLSSKKDRLDHLAIIAARLQTQIGRSWRPLVDLGLAPDGPPEGQVRHRFFFELYSEGALLWLEADVLIRQESGGRRSLHDFLRAFFGGGTDGPPRVVPYTLDELLAALDRVHHHDWKAFFDARVNAVHPDPPIDGLLRGGWRLVFKDTPSERWTKLEPPDSMNYRYSLGVVIRSGTVVDVIPTYAAGKAGLLPGMKVLAVNGRRLSQASLPEAMRAAKTSAEPIDLLVEQGDLFRTIRVDYHEGERFPHLERDPSVPDLLAKIMDPLVPQPAP
jgi:predicted metalloprotease with PDZ domain